MLNFIINYRFDLIDKSIGSFCTKRFRLVVADDGIVVATGFGFVGVIIHIPYDDNRVDVIVDGVGKNRLAPK